MAVHPAVKAVHHTADVRKNPHHGHDDHHGDVEQQPLDHGPCSIAKNLWTSDGQRPLCPVMDETYTLRRR